jgi:hypothetical protein
VWSAGGLAAGALSVYAVLAYGLAGQEPLRVYRDRAAAAVRRKHGWIVRATGAT